MFVINLKSSSLQKIGLPIYINWQKPKSKKPGFVVVPFTLPEKTHNIRGFWHEKRMREKPRISYLCFGKWCACATSLYLWPYTCSAHYIAGRGRVIPLKVTYHVTKNPNNTGEIGASVYIGKKPVKFQRSFKKSRCGGGFFDSFFFVCLGGSCLATFNEKTRMRERFGFLDASVNGTIDNIFYTWIHGLHWCNVLSLIQDIYGWNIWKLPIWTVVTGIVIFLVSKRPHDISFKQILWVSYRQIDALCHWQTNIFLWPGWSFSSEDRGWFMCTIRQRGREGGGGGRGW